MLPGFGWIPEKDLIKLTIFRNVIMAEHRAKPGWVPMVFCNKFAP